MDATGRGGAGPRGLSAAEAARRRKIRLVERVEIVVSALRRAAFHRLEHLDEVKLVRPIVLAQPLAHPGHELESPPRVSALTARVVAARSRAVVSAHDVVLPLVVLACRLSRRGALVIWHIVLKGCRNLRAQS